MVARARPAVDHRQGSACLLADRRAGPAVPGTPRHHRPRPTARPRTGRPGSGAEPPLPGHPPAARPAPATEARLRAGLRAADPPGMGPRSRPRRTIVPRQAVLHEQRTREQGNSSGCGRPAPSAKPSERCEHASGGGEQRMLLMNGGPLTVPSASSRGTRPGDPARSRCPVPAEGRQGSVAGLVVVAVACSPQIVGASGRCLLRIPFGISAMREPGAAAHRSEQASRMSRNRQEQRPGGGAGRTRR
jgi:hypothetical protein